MVIVIIGSPLHRPGSDDRPSGVGGSAVAIAVAAVSAGREVQLVGRVGDDPAGDATLVALSRAGVGHVATLRDPAHATPVVPPIDEDADADPDQALELIGRAQGDRGPDPVPAATLDRDDLELALRYLTGFGVIVVAEALPAEGLAVVADAAAYVGAASIVLVPAGGDASAGTASALVIEAPERDPDELFARTIGALAAALDAGMPAAEALATITAAQGWDRAEG